MKRLQLMLIISMALLFSGAALAGPKKPAKPQSCAQHALKLIRAGYSEGGMKLRRISGPFLWNESFNDGKGNPGIRPRVAYLVSHGWHKEFRKKNRPGEVLIIGECTEGGPSRLVDRDRNKAVDLNDLTTVKQTARKKRRR